MSYCTVAELVAATGSAYDSSVLQEIIDRADRQIRARLAPHGLSGSGDVIREASLSLSTSLLLVRMRMDGTRPASKSIGGISVSDNPDQAIRGYEERAWQLTDQYIQTANRRAWVKLGRR